MYDSFCVCIEKKIWKDRDWIVQGAYYLAGLWGGPPTATAVLTTTATTPAGQRLPGEALNTLHMLTHLITSADI